MNNDDLTAPMSDDPIEVEKFIFDRIAVRVQELIDRDELHGLHAVAFRAMVRDFVPDRIVAELRAFVLGTEKKAEDQYASRTVRYPDGWWQMFKHQYAPKWFLRRWPVKWHNEHVSVKIERIQRDLFPYASKRLTTDLGERVTIYQNIPKWNDE